MNLSDKISSAFEPFLAKSKVGDKRDAIVIYRTPNLEQLPLRGRLRELNKRLERVKRLAAEQKQTQSDLFGSYKQQHSGPNSGQQELATSSIGGTTLPIANFEVTRASLVELAARPEVIAILPNQKIQLIEPQKVNHEELARGEVRDGLTWGLKQLNITKMWETTKGDGINVAVLDTGVYGKHPALRDRIADFVVIDTQGRRIAARPSFDAGQHGTHVCGTIAGGKTPEGLSIGVAPEANLYVGGVLIGNATLSTMIAGIDWAIEQGVDIINMSFGMPYYEPKFADILTTLIEMHNILPVVAIGNANHGNSSCPGNVHNAFSIGAAEKMPDGKLEVAAFSSGASLVFPGDVPDSVTKPDVCAPGVQVYSCIPPQERPTGMLEYTYMDGTSMATPHISGVAALLMAARPEAPVTAIMQAMKDTAKHPNGPLRRPDNRWAWGMVQPVEALKALD